MTIFELTNQYKDSFFSARKTHKLFLFSSPSEIYVFPFDFVLERDPKKNFYYQRDVETYTDQVLDILLFDKHECTN